MNLEFTQDGWEQYQYWLLIDKKILKKINQLIEDVLRHPFEGIGKPEALKHDFKEFWSRRITDEHRLVYYVKEDRVIVVQCRFHYS
jgi:toxin YoeB